MPLDHANFREKNIYELFLERYQTGLPKDIESTNSLLELIHVNLKSSKVEGVSFLQIPLKF